MVYIYVGLAGILGALSRYYLGIVINGLWSETFPIATLLINLIGCFILGGFTSHFKRLERFHPALLTAIGTGFVGSFTTFSTFSVETVNLMKQQLWGLAVLYILLSLWGGLLLSWLGYKIGHQFYTKGYLSKDNDTREGGDLS